MPPYYPRPDGEERTTHFFFEHRLLGDYTGCLTGQPSQFSFQALANTELVIIDYAVLRQIYEERPVHEWSGRHRLVGKVVFTGPVQVRVGKHRRGRKGGQPSSLLLGGAPGQVLREGQVIPADDGVHQPALAGFGIQLPRAGGGVQSLGQAKDKLTLVKSLVQKLIGSLTKACYRLN